MARSDPRLELVCAAERLMALRGVHAPSLREIAEAAGNTNNSAVQYHFGDRAALVAAVFAHRMAPVERQRAAMVDELLADGVVAVGPLVAAFVVPFADAVDLTTGSTWYGRFAAQAFGTPDLVDVVDAPDLPNAALRRTVALLRRALVDELGLDAAIAATRLDLMALLVTHALGDRERRLAGGADAAIAADAFVGHLLAAATAVLVAPPIPDSP